MITEKQLADAVNERDVAVAELARITKGSESLGEAMLSWMHLYDAEHAEVKLLDGERDVLRAMLVEVLASAHPHPVEHPTMTRAWKRAQALLDGVK